MKLAKRDIQYVMNEARRIVAEKSGIMKGARGAVQGAKQAVQQRMQQGAY